MAYDSTSDTTKHIRRVQELLRECIDRLETRREHHDASKLSGIEKHAYDALGENLRGITYGSPEYMAQFQHPLMKEGLGHHFAHNSHHAEHWPNGVNDMSLLDVIEMTVDWKAASERHADGDIVRSVEVNRERYGISDQLAGIILNTYRDLGVLSEDGG